MKSDQRRPPPAFRRKLRAFLNLESEEQVAKALAETGAILIGNPFNAATMTTAQRDAFKRSWRLSSDDEVNEALELAGLVTVIVGDLREAATTAKHPLIVAK